MGKQEVWAKWNHTLLALDHPTLSVLSLQVSSPRLLSSSMWWTVLGFGGGGLVSWLPWQLQQSTDVSILCGGAQGLW